MNWIEVLTECGFTHVRWYDEDLDYIYYDGKMHQQKVEIRLGDTTLDWRYLGTSTEDIIWNSLGNPQQVKENVEFNRVYSEVFR